MKIEKGNCTQGNRTIDGRLHISNAGTENKIFPFTLGRRRWLFCDTPQRAKPSAIYHSLIETCNATGMDPEENYRHILARIAEANSLGKLEALLP